MMLGLGLAITGGGQGPDAWVLRDDQGSKFLWDADFVANRYYLDGVIYPTLAAWRTAMGSAFTRASAAGYRDPTGAWAVAASGALRQHRTAAAKALGLLLEGSRTQFLSNPSAPAPQSPSLGANTYACSMNGGGTVTLSGGPTDVVTEGSPAIFTLGSTTSVTFTPDGDVTRFQCELAFPSSFMATSRSASDALSFGPNGSSLPFAGFSATEGTLVTQFRTAQGFRTSDQMLMQLDDATNNNRIALYRSSSGAVLSGIVVSGGVTQANPSQATSGAAALNDEDNSVAMAWKANDVGVSFNGSAEIADGTASMPTVTRMTWGNKNGADQWFGTVARIAYTPRRVPTLSTQRSFFAIRTGAVHGLGDSFMSSGYRTALDALIANSLTTDGVGGSTLTEQLTRWSATPALWNDTLILNDDMAPWTDSGADIATMLATYASILAKLSSGRFLILEPGLPLGGVGGSASRIERDNKWNAIVAAYPNNVVPILAPMQATASGATDDTYVAANIWPASCYTDPGASPSTVVDGHPNTKGNGVYAQETYAALVAKGWL